MPPRIRFLLVALTAACAIVAGGAAVRADSTIKVLVNDEAITSYDVAQRTSLMALAGEKGGAKLALDQLIDEAVEISEAKKRGFVAPDARVSAAYASIAGNMKLTPDALSKALQSRGVSPDALKRRLKVQISWQQLMQARNRFEVSVKPSDVTAQLLAKGSPDNMSTTEFILQQIIFVIPAGSSAGYITQRRREAEAFRIRFQGCDTSVELAKGLKDVLVRPFGRHMSNDLTGPDGKMVQDTPVGKTTKPTQLDQGITLVAVCSKRDIKSNAAARTEIEQKLAFEQGKDLGKDYLKELRGKAVIEYR
jgi:peptidyl-prolyl cis-trans isomerase SurA